MNRILYLLPLLSALVCIGAPAVLGQDVNLLYREGGTFRSERMVQITHVGPDGSHPPDTAAVYASDHLHFAVRPVGDWTLSMDDLSTVRQIVLRQGERRIPADDARLIASSETEPAILLAVRKRTLSVTEPVRFKNDLATSDPLMVDEAFAPGYAQLRTVLAEGTRALTANRPQVAIVAFRPFLSAADSVQTLSITATARVRLDTAVVRMLRQTSERFRQLQAAAVDSVTIVQVTTAEAFQKGLDQVREVLSPYLTTPSRGAEAAQRELDFLQTSAENLHLSFRRSYRANQMYRFQRGTYADGEMRLYLRGITRLLLDPVRAHAMTEEALDSLRVADRDSPRYDELRRALQQRGWWGDFQEVARLINVDIQERRRLFGDETMLNLKLRRPAAPQPYYELIAAMNALGTGDRAAFQEHWTRALEKSSDVALVHDMQRWRQMARHSPDARSERVLALMQEGEALLADAQWTAAEERFRTAEQLGGRDPMLAYRLGRIAQERADTLAARRHFRAARRMDSTFVPAEAALLDLLMEHDRYDEALHRADSALTTQPYWTLYVRKARALYGLERYDDARFVLRGRCEPLNDESLDLYLLLTDVYVQMKIWDGAQWALGEAHAIAPGQAELVERRRRLQLAASAAGVVLEASDADSDTLGRQ